jgi:hypothetical protein
MNSLQPRRATGVIRLAPTMASMHQQDVVEMSLQLLERIVVGLAFFIALALILAPLTA